jgi:hypothetical protein
MCYYCIQWCIGLREIKDGPESRFTVLEAREKRKSSNRQSAELIGAVDVGEVIVVFMEGGFFHRQFCLRLPSLYSGAPHIR